MSARIERFIRRGLLLAMQEAQGTPAQPDQARDGVRMYDGTSGTEVTRLVESRGRLHFGVSDIGIFNQRAFVAGTIHLYPSVSVGAAPDCDAILRVAGMTPVISIAGAVRYVPISADIPFATVDFYHARTYRRIFDCRAAISDISLQVGQRASATAQLLGFFTHVADADLPDIAVPATLGTVSVNDNSRATATIGDGDTVQLHAKSLAVDCGTKLVPKHYTSYRVIDYADRQPTFKIRMSPTLLTVFDPWSLRTASAAVNFCMRTSSADGYTEIGARGVIESINEIDIAGDYCWELSGSCMGTATGGDEFYVEFGSTAAAQLDVLQWQQSTVAFDVSGDTASAQLTIVRDGSHALPVSAQITLSSTDFVSGVDFDPGPHTVTGAADAGNSISYSLQTQIDLSVSQSGTITATLSDPVNATLGTITVCDLTIDHFVDDRALSFSPADYDMDFSDDGSPSALLYVVRAGDLSDYIAVDVSFSSTDFVAGVDFDPGPFGIGVPADNPGPLQHRFSGNFDYRLAYSGAITATLSSPTNGFLVAPTTAVITVFNAGDPLDVLSWQSGTVAFDVSGDTASAQLTIVRDGSHALPVSAQITFSSADFVAGVDFDPGPHTVTGAADAGNSISYSLQTQIDLSVSQSGTITATLSDPVNATLGTITVCDLTIDHVVVPEVPRRIAFGGMSYTGPSAGDYLAVVDMPGNTESHVSSAASTDYNYTIRDLARINSGSQLVGVTDSRLLVWDVSASALTLATDASRPTTGQSYIDMVASASELVILENSGYLIRVSQSTLAEVTPRPTASSVGGTAMDINAAGTLAIVVGTAGGRSNRYTISGGVWTRITTSLGTLPPSAPAAVRFNPAGNRCIIGGSPTGTTKLVVYSVSGSSMTSVTSASIATADQPPAGVTAIEWSPDGRYVAVGHDDPAASNTAIRIYDTSTSPWTAIVPPQPSEAGCFAIAWSADSTELSWTGKGQSDSRRRWRIADGVVTQLANPVQGGPYWSNFDVMYI